MTGSSSPNLRAAAWCGLVLLLLGAAGCGAPSGSVKGKVYYQDKPLTGGTVLFVPAAGGASASATIDEQGNYSITKIPTGLAKIAVDSGPPPPQSLMKKPPAAGKMMPPKDTPLPEGADPSKLYGTRPGAGGSVAIPDKYKDYEKSGETYTVQPGAQEYDIRLK
jgi:hypothetical protein